MKNIIRYALILFFINNVQLLFGQKVIYKILNVSRENNNYNNIINYYDEIEMEGDSSGYKILLHSRKKIEGISIFDYNSYDSDELIVLKKDNAEMFKNLIKKYFEWHNMAKIKKINLTKTMYSPTIFDNINLRQYKTPLQNNYRMPMRQEYEKNKTITNIKKEIKQFEVIYENGYLVFKCQKKITYFYSDNTDFKDFEDFNMKLSYNDLKKIKKIIDDGTYDKKIKEFKNANKSWDEFKGF